MNIYVDIDNTICITEGSDYPNSTPRYEQIEKIHIGLLEEDIVKKIGVI